MTKMIKQISTVLLVAASFAGACEALSAQPAEILSQESADQAVFVNGGY